MRFILVRHYKTQSNHRGRILGWGDSPPHEDWKSDVEYIGESLHEADIRFDAAYCSDLNRSRQSAQILAESFGISEVTSIPEFKEIKYGKVQTRRKSWVAQKYPLHKKDPDMVYPDGESFRQMQQRSVRYVDRLVSEYPQQCILLVSHAGVIRGLISHFLGLEYADCLKQYVSHRYIGDFQFEGTRCKHYQELGKPSGFVTGGMIQLPFLCPEVSGL
jgi:broad specificity phosphatase PhoE